MTAEKKPLTEEERLEARRREKERLENLLAAHPGIIAPTGKNGPSVFSPVKIRGKPISQTIIEDRR